MSLADKKRVSNTFFSLALIKWRNNTIGEWTQMKKESRNLKFTIEEIEEYIAENRTDIKLVSKEYEGNKIPLNFECLICEHNFNLTWNDMSSKGRSCPACGKNGEKLSKNQMSKRIEEFDYKITEFLGADSHKGTKFSVQCNRGHEYDTSYRTFLHEEQVRGGSCKQCVEEGFPKTRKKIIKQIKQNLIDWGYTFLEDEEIKVIADKRTFVCLNGHERYAAYEKLEIQPNCPTCSGHVLKHTEETISEALSKVNIKYIGGFINTSTPFIYECECGEEASARYHRLLSGERCPECSTKRFWKYDEVVQYYQERGFELLEDVYVGTKIPMKYKCSCEREYIKSFNEFQSHPLCKSCSENKRPKGENHHGWNPNLSNEDRLKSRKYPAYKEWRIAVYERDKYTCQCCGDNKGHNLQAHHILNHSEYKDLRLDLDNGITLCDTCHVDFHNLYGYKNNSYEQLEEYIRDILNESAS